MCEREQEPSITAIRRAVRTADLQRCTPFQSVVELSLPLPWLMTAWYASANGWYPLTLLASFYFFLTGLRVAHNAFHHALGLSRRSTDGVMAVLSVLMLGSLHAVRATHLIHHRHCMGERDVEGKVAAQSALGALLRGPLFPFAIHLAGWRSASRDQRRWIALELSLNIVWLVLVWICWSSTALKLHTVLMLLAYSLSAFFAVWTVHRDCEASDQDNARTLRSRWKSVLSYGMFFHVEHHWFPAVPTCRMPELSRRLDAAGYRSHKSVW